MESIELQATHTYTIASAATALGFAFFLKAVPAIFAAAHALRPRGKHLDAFQPRDKLCIAINAVLTTGMTYHTLGYVLKSPNILKDPADMTLLNTLGALPLLFATYDLFYSQLHRALHHRSLYAYVHKHHHRQVVPTRGLLDSINVHPLEYVSGEYIHLLTIHVVCRFLFPLHCAACLLFLSVGGMCATLNHTRLGVRVSLPGVRVPLFDVRAHDTHHCVPNSNYGQYTMLWDSLFGTYKGYDSVKCA